MAPGVLIDPGEWTFTFARSDGPGGQNVNKVNTSATLWFDLERSRSLSDEQKARIRAYCRNRIDSMGLLRVVCRRFRTQAANRRGAVERLAELIAAALTPRKRRRPTRPGRAATERRLKAKQLRSRRKRERRARFAAGD